jgi:hypothetical protein
VKSIKAKHSRKATTKTPSDIIGNEKVLALKRAGYLVLHRSELLRFRTNVKSVLDMLSSEES